MLDLSYKQLNNIDSRLSNILPDHYYISQIFSRHRRQMKL